MQITRAGEYAIIGLQYLARQPAERVVMIEEISAAEHISRSFLAKIFQSLVKSGLVASHRGARGGFALARPASQISVLQVLNSVEGAFSLQKCVTNNPECVVPDRRLSSCQLCGLFSEAQEKVNEVFSRTTLQDLLGPRKGTASRRVAAAANV